MKQPGDQTAHGPNGAIKTSRALSIHPKQSSTTHILSALSQDAQRFKIKHDEDHTSLGLSPFPEYLHLCMRRLNMTIIEATGKDPCYTTVARCALLSGLRQLELDIYVLKLIALKRESWLVKAGGMMITEAERINSGWKFRPIIPPGSGFMKTWRLKIRPDTHARLLKLSDDLGLTISLLSTTSMVFGLYNQAEVGGSLDDKQSHVTAISDHVHSFDMQILIKVEMAELIIRLMRDNHPLHRRRAKGGYAAQPN